VLDAIAGLAAGAGNDGGQLALGWSQQVMPAAAGAK
jgi:hypothetical protein